MERAAWAAVAISAGAFIVSVFALLVSIAAHRAAGPRVAATTSTLTVVREECWLGVTITNSGRSAVELKTAWADWLGQAISGLSDPLSGGSSRLLEFRARLPPLEYLESSLNSLTVRVLLGNGQTVKKRVPPYEVGIAKMAARQAWMAREQGRDDSSPAASVTLPIEEVDG